MYLLLRLLPHDSIITTGNVTMNMTMTTEMDTDKDTDMDRDTDKAMDMGIVTDKDDF
jgi:hypothetical protein